MTTEDWGTEIIIIEGTRTHDNLQINNLVGLFSMSTLDARVTGYTHTQPIDLNGVNVLLVPEEYVTDQESYYGRFFKDDSKYDIIIGHGMVDKIWYAKKNKESQSELTKHMSAPVFKVDDLLNHCTKCYFGHVHMNRQYGDGNRFTYIGPYTKWEFGTTTKAGFYHVKINIDTREVTDTFVENTSAKNYPTVALRIDKPITLTELNDKVDTLIASVYANVSNVGKVRLIVTLSQKVDTWQTIKDFLISKCGDMANLKFILQLEEKDSEPDDTVTEMDGSKSYIFDHSIEISRRIQAFIKNKSGRDIPLEIIEKYLNS